ncbi:MAG: site-specific integrase, partial [Phocaeicola dorei]
KRGRQWLRKARNKTNNMCNIPLLRPALRILEKYAEYRAATGRLLPVPSNQKMNAYLKELATLCGVAKNLTTHCARHTFATTVTLANGASLENVSKMLGHSSVRMTQHYAKILNSSIERDMDKIESELIGEDE